MIDWEKNQAFGDNDEVLAIPVEWRRCGVREKTTRREVLFVVRYDTHTHLLARHRTDRRHNIVSGPLIVEERELEPIPPAERIGMRPPLNPAAMQITPISMPDELNRILGGR